MKWFYYLWTVIIGVVEVSLIISLFGQVNSRFEEIVLSALVVIYSTIRTGFILWGFVWIGDREKDTDRFLYLARALRPDDQSLSHEVVKEIQSEENQMLSKAKIKGYISWAFLFIIYFISIYHLFFHS